jgi:GNAT superfamily N-acetyltransferase
VETAGAQRKSSLGDFTFSLLNPTFDLSPFVCGDAESDVDMAEFLKDDALNYQGEQFANTYIFHDANNRTVAYFCISNDCLNDKGEESALWKNGVWNKFHRKQDIPNAKRIRSYPSIKIGRLGVLTEFQGTGLAYELMDFIKGYAIHEIKPACRLLLLDAVNKPRQINYYELNGFKFLLDEDANNEKRLMYFDLLKLS